MRDDTILSESEKNYTQKTIQMINMAGYVFN